MFKKIDHIILAVICLFLGVFLVSQYNSTKEYDRVTQPENNAVLALEVAKLTKSNSDLRREVQDLTSNLEVYKNSTESSKRSYDQYLADSDRLDIINAAKPTTGQGIIVKVEGRLSQAQVIDIVNAIKNIGAEVISVNGTRLVLNTNLDRFIGLNSYEIKVIGNSSLLKSAMERKGGIIDQISSKEIKFTAQGSDSIEIPAGSTVQLNYARIIKN